MRKQILTVGLFICTAVVFGQKKEIKAASKAVNAGNFTEAKAILDGIESEIGDVSKKIQADFYFNKGLALYAGGNAEGDNLSTAVSALTKANELGNSKASEQIKTIKNGMINSAIEDQNSKKYGEAANKLLALYKMDKADTLYLYFAASNLIKVKKYDEAINHYKELQAIGYTGIETQFVAEDAETGEEKIFSSKVEMNIYSKSGSYINPQTKVTKSRVGEITKNMALIYVDQGKNDEAIAAFKQARAANPDDLDLILQEANLYYKIGDTAKFKSLIEEATVRDPNNPELQYNLGVISADAGENEQAMTHYKKALELDPNYVAANINISTLILDQEKVLVDEMNNLGTSAADDKRYDELKAMRSDLYRKAVPFLEAALEAKDDIDLVKTLMNIFSQIGEDAKFKAMKSKFEEMGG